MAELWNFNGLKAVCFLLIGEYNNSNKKLITLFGYFAATAINMYMYIYILYFQNVNYGSIYPNLLCYMRLVNFKAEH